MNGRCSASPIINIRRLPVDYIYIAEQIEKIASELEKEERLRQGYIKFLEKRANYWVNNSTDNSDNSHHFNNALLLGIGALSYPLLKQPIKLIAKHVGSFANKGFVRPVHWVAQKGMDVAYDLGNINDLIQTVANPQNYKQSLSRYLHRVRKGPTQIPHDFGWTSFKNKLNRIAAENPRLSKWLKYALIGSLGAAAYNWG